MRIFPAVGDLEEIEKNIVSYRPVWGVELETKIAYVDAVTGKMKIEPKPIGSLSKKKLSTDCSFSDHTIFCPALEIVYEIKI